MGRLWLKRRDWLDRVQPIRQDPEHISEHSRYVVKTDNEAVDEEFDHEQEAKICLRGRWNGTEDTCGSSKKDSACTSCCSLGGVSRKLYPVLTRHHKRSYEGSNNLSEDVVGDLVPRKSLPDSEAYAEGWVEMPSTRGSRNQYREANP